MIEPRRSAAVILHREGPKGLEVFLVARSPQLRFLGGHLAFPGGAVEKGDGDLPFHPDAAVDAAGRDRVGCGARELFEETGVLLATDRDGRPAPADVSLAELRSSLSSRGGDVAKFQTFLRERGLSVDASRFHSTARFITPLFSSVRFDTVFYAVEVREADGEPTVVSGELDSGEWRRPGDALRDWQNGALRIAPPVVDILDALASKPFDRAIEELRAIPPELEASRRAVHAAPGYDLIPLETPPLPPEIPANAFLVGWKRFVLVDPTPRRERGQDHLFAVMDDRIASGDSLAAVVLTHHHPDHVGALDAVVARYRAPVWAHPITGKLLDRKLDRALPDGAEIALGESPDGRAGWSLRAVFTPGHAEGHIALHDERTRSLIAGDLVSTLVSMYVGSPGGNLRQYFASLERVRALEVETLYPSHGTASRDPLKLIDDTLRHRKARIEEMLAALRDEPRETEALAFDVYPDAGGKLRPLIIRTTRAALEYLVEDGRAERCGEDAFRRPHPA
jgi:ribonuclease/clavin/mitogillin